mmetsp:Transcript_473/g.654  ORF Transcript_473/g.654 Transcript_473/m.654 type:complete len:498 (+) Transcript_473:313-1806(+)
MLQGEAERIAYARPGGSEVLFAVLVLHKHEGQPLHHLLAAEGEDHAVSQHCQAHKGPHHRLPRSDVLGGAGPRAAVHPAELEQVALHLHQVAQQAQEGGQGEGRGEQRDVPKLDDHLQVVIKLLIFCQIHLILNRRGRQSFKLCHRVLLPHLVHRREDRLPLGEAGELGDEDGQQGLHAHAAQRVRGVHLHQLHPQPHHVELEEGDVEERDVAVEGLEEHALEDEGVLVLVLQPVVLPVRQPLRHQPVQVVELHDGEHVQYGGHQREQQVGAVGVEERPGLRVLGDPLDVEEPLEGGVVLDVPLQVQAADHDQEGHAEHGHRHQHAQEVGDQPLLVRVVPLRLARDLADLEVALELGALDLCRVALHGPEAVGPHHLLPPPVLDEAHSPEDNEERVDGHVGVVVHGVGTQLAVEPHCQACKAGDDVPLGAEIHPGKIKSNFRPKICPYFLNWAEYFFEGMLPDLLFESIVMQRLTEFNQAPHFQAKNKATGLLCIFF